MPDALRVQAAEVRRRKLAGEELLLVCAYKDDAKFRLSRLDGAMSYSDYLVSRTVLPRSTELVFY